MLKRPLVAMLFLFALLLSACGGSDEARTTSEMQFSEGSVRMVIEYLDTGLLKGHAYAEASEGWQVATISITATDHENAQWIVIEPPGEQVGYGTANAQEFFEVRLEELPRGAQLLVKQTVIFEDEAGNSVEHTVEDRWPP